MHKSILVLVIGFLCICISAAQPGFNRIIDAGFPLNHLRDMIVVNDTIIGYGIGQADTINFQQGVILVKMDSSGNLIKSNIIVDTLGDLLSIDKFWGKITATQDGGYAMTTAPLISNSAWLVKVDQDLEIEFIKEYPDTINASNFMYSILAINNGYILYGSIQGPDLVIRPFVRRVDINGEIIWHEYFGNPNFFGLITDVTMVNDSTMIASSNEWVSTNFTGSVKSAFYHLNMEGNVVKHWESEPDADIGLVYKILPADDGDLIMFGESIVAETTFGTPIVQATFSRMGEDFNIKWIKKYGRKGTYSADLTFNDIEPTIDGNYIAAGESFTVVNGDERGTGWLMKFSPEGDSIWSRQVLPPFPPDLFNDQFFGGVGVLSSGSIVAGGSANDHGERYIWLVKVGNDGCMETYSCGLVVTGVEEEVQGKSGGMLMYPNPASCTVTIELEEGMRSDGLVVFFNAQGREVMRRALPAKNRKTAISVENLSSGLFYIEIWDGSHNILRQSKLIVNH